MADEQIIKAMEHCISSNDLSACWKCPGVELDFCCDGSSKISKGIAHKVIDLLKRNDATIKKQNAEIKNLKDTLRIHHNYNPAIRHARIEAYKEFAKRLDANLHECGCNYRKKPVYAVTKENIDTTLKELTETTKK